MAANRTLRVTGALSRSSSRYSKKALMRPASSCFQRQSRWRDLQSLCSEREEQLEAQGIGVARMPTDAPLAGERFIEERFDKGSNRRHDGLPSAKNPSPAAAMLRMRSAVASRYQ